MIEAPTAEEQMQSAAIEEYIAAREEREGLIDDMFYGGYADKAAAKRKKRAADARYVKAVAEAKAKGVYEVGRRLFR